MTKPEQHQDDGRGDSAAPAETGLTVEAITETMKDPAFTPEQLSGLWQRIEAKIRAGSDDVECWIQWDAGIEAMYRRCGTYLQHATLAVALSEMPKDAWHETSRIIHQGKDLVEQATPEQLRQALEHEQQRPGKQRTASSYILSAATVDQLTGPVIEQLPWDDLMLIGGRSHSALRDLARSRHIVEHVQQQLLGGNNAWTVFLGIVEPGMLIGEAAELANIIEQ